MRMLTIFTTAKPFRGHIDVIQRNAIRSWKLLHRDIEVILFGDDEGSAEAARELGARHEPEVKKNEFGTILVSSMFQRAQELASHNLLCCANCDIVLLPDFIAALEKVTRKHEKFLMVGRRWDMEIKKPLAFETPGWDRELRNLTSRIGKRRAADWIDYFAFTRGTYGEIPDFAVGRTCWDDWLLWSVADSGCAVVDATRTVVAVHQNHDYSHHPQGETGVWRGVEAQRNRDLAGGWQHLRTIADATYKLGPSGLTYNLGRHWEASKRWAGAARRAMRYRVWNPVWFFMLDLTRPLRTALGLRGKNVGHEK